MTLPELAEKACVPLAFLKNLDDIVPDQEIDGGEQCYTYISSIAWILGIPGSQLRIAFARQEIPLDQYPEIETTPEEDFADTHLEDEKPLPKNPDNTFTPKEKRDIAKGLEKIMSGLESDEAIAFNGEPLDDETKELMRVSLENSMRLAKQIAKKKFTPKKYK